MSASVDWPTKVITVFQADLTLISGTLYELDVDALRLELKALEAEVVDPGQGGMAFEDTHRHNTEVVISGITYARTFEIINGYTLTFEHTGSNYQVRLAGANNNIVDVTNFALVSVIPTNSAGLIAGGFADTIADEVLNGADGVEVGFTLAHAIRIVAAAVAGKVSGAPGSPVFRNLGDTQDQITGTADSDGNRSAASYGA